MEYGYNYAGFDIDIIKNIYHWGDCAKRCKNHRSCSFWTWNQWERRCYLKTSKNGREGGKGGNSCISGAWDCVSEC